VSLVGDIILDLRARIPDAPGTLNPPNILDAVPIYDPNGTLASDAQSGGNIQIAVTGTNVWGETITSPQSPMTIAISPPATGVSGPTYNAVLVTVGATPPPWYTAINIYETGAVGYTILGRYSYPMPVDQGTLVVEIGLNNDPLLLPTSGHSTGPPAQPSAFLPDTDGNFLSAYAAYRLLNRALTAMVKIAGGIIDVTGVQSTINTSMYRLSSPFYQFVNAWYDGYPMDVVQRSMMYLRNSAAGFSGILSYEQDGPQSTIQVWPQSNRTGGLTSLADTPMGATDQSLIVQDASGFLSIGLLQVDQEVMGYSLVQQLTTGFWQISGLIRGLGGTDPVPHNVTATVTELNIRLSGYRMCENYAVGNQFNTLMVPQAWEEPLVLHMLGQVRSMEQDEAAAKELFAQFVADAEKIAKGSRLGRLKPRQIPIWGQNTSDARNVNGIGFGWLIN
jgi:hypothetical protein